MIVSPRLERFTLKLDQTRFAAQDGTDPSRASWRAGAGGQGEQQFVIFATVKGAIQCRSPGYWNIIELSRHARLSAQAVQIYGEPVADIHARRGATHQALAQR